METSLDDLVDRCEMMISSRDRARKSEVNGTYDETQVKSFTKEKNKIIRQYVIDYKKNLRNFLLTTRFNDATWNENIYYRLTHPGINCIYCSPSQITESVPIDNVLFLSLIHI